MAKFESVKRATVGNLVKADAAGDGTYVVGRITASDTKKGTISYAPADGTDEIIIKRDLAYKATQAEYDEQLPAGKAKTAKSQPVSAAEWEKMTAPAPRETEEVKLEDLESEEDEEDDGKEKPLARVKDYLDRYDVVIAASGKKSRDAGDAVAKDLRGMKLGDIYKRAASILSVPIDELISRYAHLNEGQQRMNLGNRLRGFYRREAKQEEEAAAKRAAQQDLFEE